jgi:hypothetical protein
MNLNFIRSEFSLSRLAEYFIRRGITMQQWQRHQEVTSFLWNWFTDPEAALATRYESSDESVYPCENFLQ